MRAFVVPDRLRAAVETSGNPSFHDWMLGISASVSDLALRWGLVVGDPFEPGGQCAWVAPAADTSGAQFALKLGWRHPEAEHEPRALAVWNGNGAVRISRYEELPDTNAMLLERCEPGRSLSASLPEPERDPIVASLLRQLRQSDFDASEFASLADMCDRWTAEFEANPARLQIDPGMVRSALALLKSMPRDPTAQVLLSTDLHGDNVLSSQREGWLAIDPKPHVGDPAFDVVQHIGTSYSRMQSDPMSLVGRMSDLAEVDEERVRRWLFARAVQERPGKPWLQRAVTTLAV